ncbi:hypothetical protein M9458_009359, partial [Cirrhinus mrigala]
ETASVMRKSMDRSEKDLEKVSADSQQAVENLKSLTEEAQNLQEITSDKQQQVLNVKHSDPRGEKSTQIFRLKFNTHLVHLKCVVIISFRVLQGIGLVKESAQIRKAAEAKLGSTEKEFNLKHQLHIQRLDKIGSELDSADLSRLS